MVGYQSPTRTSTTNPRRNFRLRIVLPRIHLRSTREADDSSNGIQMESNGEHRLGRCWSLYDCVESYWLLDKHPEESARRSSRRCGILGREGWVASAPKTIDRRIVVGMDRCGRLWSAYSNSGMKASTIWVCCIIWSERKNLASTIMENSTWWFKCWILVEIPIKTKRTNDHVPV